MEKCEWMKEGRTGVGIGGEEVERVRVLVGFGVFLVSGPADLAILSSPVTTKELCLSLSS